MLKFGNKEFRNLQEQVAENMRRIGLLTDEQAVLDEFGIKVVGQVAGVANMPTVEEYKEDNPSWEYGDAFAVGTNSPYTLYILTRANSTHDEDYWFNIGEFPAVGPQGPQGPKGDQGIQGQTGNPGQDGASAGFGVVSAQAETLSPNSSATVTVTTAGPNTAKEFSFVFGIPQGEPGISTGGTWGEITGNISDQLDLDAALNAKQDLINAANKLSVDYISGLANVATSGSYNDLSDKPDIPSYQVQADWDETNTSAVDYIKNKPDLSVYAKSADLANVATTGNYSDLLNKPNLSAVATSGNYSDLLNKPNLSAVATSGNYSDLLNKPTLGTAAAKDYTASVTNGSSDLVTSGAVYTAIDTAKTALSSDIGNVSSDVTNLSGQLTNTATNLSSDIANVAHDVENVSGAVSALDTSLANVAKSGDYNDLLNKPILNVVGGGSPIQIGDTFSTGDKIYFDTSKVAEMKQALSNLSYQNEESATLFLLDASSLGGELVPIFNVLKMEMDEGQGNYAYAILDYFDENILIYVSDDIPESEIVAGYYNLDVHGGYTLTTGGDVVSNLPIGVLSADPIQSDSALSAINGVLISKTSSFGPSTVITNGTYFLSGSDLCKEVDNNSCKIIDESMVTSSVTNASGDLVTSGAVYTAISDAKTAVENELTNTATNLSNDILNLSGQLTNTASNLSSDIGNVSSNVSNLSSSLANVAFSGNYSDLSGIPILGNASSLNATGSVINASGDLVTSGGVFTAISDATSNMVTTNTSQIITGIKKIITPTTANNLVIPTNGLSFFNDETDASHNDNWAAIGVNRNTNDIDTRLMASLRNSYGTSSIGLVRREGNAFLCPINGNVDLGSSLNSIWKWNNLIIKGNISNGNQSFSVSDYANLSSSLSNVAFSGSYSDLSNTPSLGTAAAKNYTSSVTNNSSSLVTSGAVYSAIAGQTKETWTFTYDDGTTINKYIVLG